MAMTMPVAALYMMASQNGSVISMYKFCHFTIIRKQVPALMHAESLKLMEIKIQLASSYLKMAVTVLDCNSQEETFGMQKN